MCLAKTSDLITYCMHAKPEHKKVPNNTAAPHFKVKNNAVQLLQYHITPKIDKNAELSSAFLLT